MHIASLAGTLVEERYAIDGVSRGHHFSLVGSWSLRKHQILWLRSYITFLLENFLLLSRRGVIGKVLVIHSRLCICLWCSGLCSYQLSHTGRLWLGNRRIVFIWSDVLPLTNLLLTVVSCVLINSCLTCCCPLLLTHAELISLLPIYAKHFRDESIIFLRLLSIVEGRMKLLGRVVR